MIALVRTGSAGSGNGFRAKHSNKENRVKFSSVRMVRVVEHEQPDPEPLNEPIDQVEKQVNAQMYWISAMLAKDSDL